MKNKILGYNFEFPDMSGLTQEERHDIVLYYEGYMIEYHYHSYYDSSESYKELSIKIHNNHNNYSYSNDYYNPLSNDETLDKIINSFFGLGGLEEFKNKIGITNLIQEEIKKVY